MDIDEMNHYVLECARYGEDEDLRTLFNAGANVNYQDDLTGNTGLHRAAANSEIKCMKVLLEHEALHLTNKLGNTPTHWAAQNGQAEALKFLLENYKDIDVLQQNKSGRSALTEAFQSENQECIELCLSHPSATEERLLDPKATSESENVEDADNGDGMQASNAKESASTTVEGDSNSKHDELDEKNAVTHRMIIGRSSSDEVPRQVRTASLLIRELPITRADNPFGTETAPEDDTTGSFSFE